VRPRRYPGMKGNIRKMRDKYADCERSKVHHQNIRKLTPLEIQEWHERMERILNPGYVVVEVKTRRAIV
jgi:hypothetical protein